MKYKLIGEPQMDILTTVLYNRNIENLSEFLNPDVERTNPFNFKMMKKEKLVITKTILLSLIQHTVFFAVTYMVYRAFGNVGATFFQIVTTQAFLMLIMTIFPTPGAGIGAEGGFLLLFSSIFKKETLSLSILFWRIYVFYLPIIVGALFFIPAKRKENIE